MRNRVPLILTIVGLAMATIVSPAAAGSPAPPMADVSITKSDAPDPVLAGGSFVYTLTIQNAGPDGAGDVVVNDTIPAALSIDSIQVVGGWGTVTVLTGGGNDLQIIFDGLMPVGATATIAIHVTLDAGVPNGSFFDNTATVTSSTFDPTAANNTSTAQTLVGPAAVATPTPAASLANAAMATSRPSSPLSTFGFAVLLIGTLLALAMVSNRRAMGHS